MKRAAAVLVSLATLAGCLGGDPYHRLAKDLSAPLAGQKRRVAVLPFRGLDPALNAEGEAMSERLLSRLYGKSGIELIERSRLQQVMSEMSLGATGALDGKSTKELGRLLGAEALVLGTVVRAQKGLELAARVVDVESGRLLAASTARLPNGSNIAPAAVPAVSRRPVEPPKPTPASEPPSAPGRDLGPGTKMPWPVAVFGAAAVDRRLYVFGGTSANTSGPGRGDSTVMSAVVLKGGALGRWRAEKSLPEGRYQVGAASWKRWVFAVGGHEGSPKGEVFTASADSSGVLGDWRRAGSLPIGCTNPGVLVVRGRLYVAGCAAADGYSAELYHARVEPDGTLGPWGTVPLPRKTGNCTLVFDGSRLLLLGGALVTHTYTSEILAVSIGPDGPVPGVKNVGSMPVRMSSFPAAVHGGRLWIVGGVTLDGPPARPSFKRDSVISAPLTAAGGIGPWRASPKRLDPVVSMTYAPIVDGEFFFLGGEGEAGRHDAIQRIPAR